MVDRIVADGQRLRPAASSITASASTRCCWRGAEESAAAEGKAVIGFYHSHPDHPARPSEYDRTHVPPWNFYSHVIVAIEKKQPAAMTCWVFNEETEQFDEQADSPGVPRARDLPCSGRSLSACCELSH